MFTVDLKLRALLHKSYFISCLRYPECSVMDSMNLKSFCQQGGQFIHYHEYIIVCKENGG